MAGLLAVYQEMQRMDEQQLAAELGCAPERLPLLGLCREPRRDQAQFAADVREIAGYAGAKIGQLARLIRSVDAARALRSRRGDAGYLAAARDAEDQAVDGEPGAGAEPEEGSDGNLA